MWWTQWGSEHTSFPLTTTITALGAARLFYTTSGSCTDSHAALSLIGVHSLWRSSPESCTGCSVFTLSTTTAYHPQADGQTERVNQELEQYLRVFVNERQDDWDELLLTAEFQYNNHIHSSNSTDTVPTGHRQHPRMGFEPTQSPSHLETVNEFTDRMHSALTEAKSALAKAQDYMSRYYNRRREPAPEYAPGDKVYLDGSDIRTSRPSKKLAHRFLGPYVVGAVLECMPTVSALPPSMSASTPSFQWSNCWLHLRIRSPDVESPTSGSCSGRWRRGV